MAAAGERVMASSAGEDLQLGDLRGWSWRGNGEQRGKDLPALGWRHRRHYDMRATFITSPSRMAPIPT